MASDTRGGKVSTKEDIKQWTDEFLKDRKKCNNLINILRSTEESWKLDVLLAGVRGLHKIFQQLLRSRELYLDYILPEEKDRNASEKYKSWLRDRYKDAVEQLLGLLHHDNKNAQELALCTLMKLIAVEAEFPIQKLPPKQLSFPKHILQEIILNLVCSEKDLSILIGRFSEYMEFDDIRYYSLKTLRVDIKERSNEPGQEVYLNNVFTLLDNCCLKQAKEDILTKMYCQLSEPEGSVKHNSLKEHRKLFTSIWLHFLRHPLTTSLYKKILISLHEKVVPNITSPLLLSDFLTESYNIGGAISLLALNSLFLLIHKHNLEYPDFFKKLYALFEPGIFHVKYKARFFHLADLFLTSSHLPAYLVAAFIKRLSRISLTAPPSGLKLSIPFIYNLLNRHPSCNYLLHKAEGPKDLKDDPYLPEESDPAKCQAMESSLWEIKTLQSHYYPDVALLCQKINSRLPSEETNLSDLLELTTGELFQKQIKKPYKESPMNYTKPVGLFGSGEKIGHLPAYLVAAFIKRLSRISLTAPPSGLKLSIPFIYNLLNRHPSCNYLLHKAEGPKDLKDDPYLPEESDPAKCQAMESSLWEIKTLQSHYYPDVALLCQKINSRLPSEGTNLSDLLELTTGELFQKQIKKPYKESPMNYTKPVGLFGSGEKIGSIFTLV